MDTMVDTINHTFVEGLQENSALVNAAIRDEAREVLSSTPLPTTKTEAWKYTRIAKAGKKSYQLGSLDKIDASAYQIEPKAIQLVFVNGIFDINQSTVISNDQITVKEISSSPKVGSLTPLTGELFNAVNTLFANSGYSIDVKPNAVIEEPIEIIQIVTASETIINQRNLISVGKSAQVEITAGYYTEKVNNSFINSITEIFVDENAHVTLNKIQNESDECVHIDTEYVSQEANSNFTIHTASLNGGIIRNNLNINVEGKNCETNLNGIYLLNGKQHVDNHTVVDHKVANCQSNEKYKGVLAEQSTGVFNGKVFVRKDAQQINAFQSNGNVLLSDDATVNSKPELEIYADDVKCSHGSTTGQLDEDAVFYLRARGLSEDSARHLLVSAFVGEVLDEISNEAVLDYIHKELGNKFGWIY